MDNYTAQITKEGNHIIFDFPTFEPDDSSVEQAFVYAKQWIKEHNSKVQDDCSYFIKLQNKKFKLQ